MRLRQQEHRLDLELQPDPAELLRQLPDPPCHVRQLLLRQQPRVRLRLVVAHDSFLRGIFVFLLQRLQVLRRVPSLGMFLPLSFALEELVYEAGRVLAPLGLLRGELGRFGGDERGFAAVDLLGFEDYLLVQISGV